MDFRICGSLELASSADHWETCKLARPRSAHGACATTLRQTVPALATHQAGAIFYPGEGQVDPRTVMSALAPLSARLDVVEKERSPIIHIEATANQVRVKTGDRAIIHATTAVLGAGAWSPPCYVIFKEYPSQITLLGPSRLSSIRTLSQAIEWLAPARGALRRAWKDVLKSRLRKVKAARRRQDRPLFGAAFRLHAVYRTWHKIR
ncbi:MAG: FAD-dependent oxidoreductase [Acidobacteria bacterium]|nr:FAD-dependent oxidoreductase [Acidobacteriota bacterium]